MTKRGVRTDPLPPVSQFATPKVPSEVLLSMSETRRPKRPTQVSLPLRIWRVSIAHKRGLGVVEAPDRETAEIVAARQFKLSDEQRERLVVQERRIGPRRMR